MKRIITIPLLIILTVGAVAQSAKEVLQKNADAEKNTTYSVNLIYTSYEDGRDQGMTETWSGTYQKTNNGYYSAIRDIMTIHEDSILLTVNDYHKEVTMSLLRKESVENNTTKMIDLNALNDEIVDIIMDENETLYTITMNFKGQYAPITKLIAKVRKEDYFFHSLTMTYSGTDEKKRAVVEIEYKNLIKNSTLSKDRQIDNYVTINSDEFTVKSERIKTYKTRNFLKN